ncbi:Flagellar motor rotation protein MotB [hydrothermal vent metagenome]|uniref:Flagellar motor rotation protein MotB n=1 Tax=hydrothermal vent metagenome TaxID=652676 RepID=A0A3B0YT49_9ZZZZ
MPRKAKQEEHENHERWLVSYADFITLLFAFFVVMYSVSSVNEGKFRVLSESMEASFRSSNKSMSPIQIGQIVRKPHEGTSHSPVKMVSLGLANMPPPRFSEKPKKAKLKKNNSAKGSNKGKGLAAEYKKKIKNVSTQIKKALLPLIKKGLVNVKLGSQWIVVDINSSILFPSGGAHLARQAVPVLERIATILRPLSSSIQVEGFTDNIPIRNLVYPSNWELSAARAASVVHLFSKTGVNPIRMAAVGYGEYQPVASNKTLRGRQKNRRVVVRVNTSSEKRFRNVVQSSSVKKSSKALAVKAVNTKPKARSTRIIKKTISKIKKPAITKAVIKKPVIKKPRLTKKSTLIKRSSDNKKKLVSQPSALRNKQAPGGSVIQAITLPALGKPSNVKVGKKSKDSKVSVAKPVPISRKSGNKKSTTGPSSRSSQPQADPSFSRTGQPLTAVGNPDKPRPIKVEGTKRSFDTSSKPDGLPPLR